MNTSIFDKNNWIKFLPKELTIITLNGRFTLKLADDPSTWVSIISPEQIQITYCQNIMSDNGGNAVKDSEPDYLEFDLSMVKENDGSEANPDTLKIDVDITYGDSMVSEFSISKPDKVSVIHYTGPHSKNVNQSMFGFTDESLSQLVTFFNRFGFSLDVKSFKFIDEYLDTYTPESLKHLQSFKIFDNLYERKLNSFILHNVYKKKDSN